VIFDLDGTLIDSVQLIVETVEGAFNEIGHEVPSEKVIRSVSGISVDEAMKILAPGADDQRIEEISAAYRIRYRAATGVAREPLFKGGLAALDALSADPETILAVATGKSFRGAVSLLERHGIIGRFHSIETPDHNRGKPDPQMIETAMHKAGVERPATVMIGDTVHDMRMAKAAGIAAIGVAWGYHERDELIAAGADVVIEDFAELGPAIDRLLEAPDA
jgi:phosphoglycolate phosphatase